MHTLVLKHPGSGQKIFFIFQWVAYNSSCCPGLLALEPCPAHYASNLGDIPIEQVASDWAIDKFLGSHYKWTSWLALDKERVLQPFTASTRVSENGWPGLWPPCFLRRLNWVAAKTMRLSTHNGRGRNRCTEPRSKIQWIFVVVLFLNLPLLEW